MVSEFNKETPIEAKRDESFFPHINVMSHLKASINVMSHFFTESCNEAPSEAKRDESVFRSLVKKSQLKRNAMSHLWRVY